MRILRVFLRSLAILARFPRFMTILAMTICILPRPIIQLRKLSNRSYIMKITRLFITAVVLLTSLFISAYTVAQTLEEKIEKDELQELLPGQLAPDFTTVDMAGVEFSLQQDAVDMPIVIDFWATWCPPCRREFPLLNDFQKAHEGEVMVVAVTSEEADSEEEIRTYLEENEIVFRIIHDPTRTFSQQYFVRAIPYVVVIDTTGTIVATHLGYSTEIREELEMELGLDPADYPPIVEEEEAEH